MLPHWAAAISERPSAQATPHNGSAFASVPVMRWLCSFQMWMRPSLSAVAIRLPSVLNATY